MYFLSKLLVDSFELKSVVSISKCSSIPIFSKAEKFSKSYFGSFRLVPTTLKPSSSAFLARKAPSWLDIPEIRKFCLITDPLIICYNN